MTWQSEVRAWAVASATVVCLCAVTYSVVDTNKHLNASIMKLNDSLDKINGKYGLIQEMGIAVVNTKTLIELGNLAERKEISQLDAWNNQFSSVVSSFQGVIGQTRQTLAAVQGTSEAATGAIQTTQATVKALQAPIAQLTATLQAGQHATEALQLAVVHLDVLVSDPAIKDTFAHTDATMSHVDAITGDAAQMTHKFAHPTKMQVFEGWLETLGVIGAKALVP